MESQSSSRPGFMASFKVLPACCNQDCMPILIAPSTFHYSIINVAVTRVKKQVSKTFKVS
jgi:hypothetical protein